MKKRVLRYAPLNPGAFALSCGIFGAAFILLTLIAMRSSSLPDPQGLAGFGFARIFVSILYGFIDGVILGVIFSWLYNKLNEKIN